MCAKGESGGPLEVDEKTLLKIEKAGQTHDTTLAMSAALGVSEDEFLAFLEREPAAKKAFERGQVLRRVDLRRIQFERAETDADTAMLLGKKYLGQTD